MSNTWKPISADLQVYPLSTYETREFYQARTVEGKFIKISPEVKLLLELMDGSHTVEEIVVIANRRYNANLTVERLEELLHLHLIPKGLVKSDETVFLPRSSLAIHIPMVQSDALEIIGLWASHFFRKNVVMLILPSILALFVWYCFSSPLLGQRDVLAYNTTTDAAMSVLIVLSSFLVHEMGHIGACMRCGLIPNSAGIGLYFFSPVFYVDTSEAWVLPAKKRAIIDIGGVYLQAIFVGVLTVIYMCTGSLVIHRTILLILLLILTNLFPFIKLDGYWALSDLIGLPNLDLRAKEYITSILRGRPQNKYLSRLQRLILPLFISGKLVFMAFFGVNGIRNLYYLFSEQMIYEYLTSLVNGLLILDIWLVLVNIWRLLSLCLVLLYLFRLVSLCVKKLTSYLSFEH